MKPWYATREDVMSATDVKTSAHNGPQVDADIDSASRAVENMLRRYFYPWTGTRYFDYPGEQYVRGWRVWFEPFYLTSLTSVTINDGTTIPVGNLFLNPQYGPPYSYAEVNLSTLSSFSAGSTWQRALAFTGLWGDHNNQAVAGTLTAGVNASATSVGVSDSSLVGVGSLLTVGAERMQVVDKALVSTTATLSGDLAQSAGADAVTVSDGTLIHSGELVTVGSEIMQVYQVAGNVLTVKRAVQGTTLAAHTSGALLYAPRTLTVSRAATGTTAASATQGAAVTVWEPPGQIRTLTVAMAVATNQQRIGGWTKESAAALNDLISQAQSGYGVRRTAAV